MGRLLRHRFLPSLMLAGLTFLLYLPVLRHDFVNFDDDRYVTHNPFVREGFTRWGLLVSLTAFHASNWHPVTWWSHMLDCQLYGLQPGGHHLTNHLLHSANAALLFLLLARLTRSPGRSAVVAVLFAWHPLHVESVAWIAERKDVLSTFFGLLSLLAYARYCATRSDPGAPSRRWYAGAVLAYLLSLMSKPMLVTLPFVLLLLDAWPLRRWPALAGTALPANLFGREALRSLLLLVREKIPFFLLSALSCAITFRAQNVTGAVASVDYVSLSARFSNTAVSYVKYLEHTFWPADLAVFYPHPLNWPLATTLTAVAILLALSFVACWRFRSAPYGLIGWLWYLGTLVPVIGLVQVGEQAMADRYTYFPLIGIFLALVWGAHAWLETVPRLTRWQPALALALLAACGLLTSRQLAHWRNSLTLFRHTLAATRENSLAHNNYGIALYEAGEKEAAAAHFVEALRIKPASLEAAKNLGNLRYQAGDWTAASQCFETALRLSPDDPFMHFNLANTLAMLGQPAAAGEHYSVARHLRPLDAEIVCVHGLFLARQGRPEAALAATDEALRLRPNFPEAQNQRGSLLAATGRTAEACAAFERALALNPQLVEAHLNYGDALVALGKTAGARTHFEAALRLRPDSTHGRTSLGALLARAGQAREAVPHFREVVRLEPANADAHYNLANALRDSGEPAAAAQEYAAALRLNPRDEKARERLARLRQKFPELVP